MRPSPCCDWRCLSNTWCGIGLIEMSQIDPKLLVPRFDLYSQLADGSGECREPTLWNAYEMVSNESL